MDWQRSIEALQREADVVIGQSILRAARPGPNLDGMSFLAYQMRPPRPGLCSLNLIALSSDKGASSGTIGIEIVAPDRSIVCQQAVPAPSMPSDGLLRFAFPPIPESNRGEYELRVFARGVSARVLESRFLAPVWGRRRLRVRPILGMSFDGASRSTKVETPSTNPLTRCTVMQRTHEPRSRMRHCARPDLWEPRVGNHPG